MPARLENELQITQSIENLLKDMPSYVVEWHDNLYASKKTASTRKDFIRKIGKFLSSINNDIKDVDDYSITLKDLWKKTKDLNCIYIAHYYRKSPEICESELIDFKNCGIDDYRIFKEPSNYRTLGLFATFHDNVIIGSDVQDWNKYGDSNFSELKLSVDSDFILIPK